MTKAQRTSGEPVAKSLTYKQALKTCKRVGTAHATGPALCAMYAGLIELQHGGSPERYYTYLQTTGDDNGIAVSARKLLRDRAKAWDVLMGQI
jgi:hypothetical protein